MRRVLALLLLTACSSATTPGATALGAQVPPVKPATDSVDVANIPAGFGTLKQDQISLFITLTRGLQVRATPLDERIIRVLSPDSYNAMRQNRDSRKLAIDSLTRRARGQSYSLWYVTFYGVEQGETRFSPQEFVIRNVGRDFHPISVLPLSPGFGDNRVKQRETHTALYVFDGQIDVNQPLSAQMENTSSSTDWQAVLSRVEQERSSARSRAASARKPPATKQ